MDLKLFTGGTLEVMEWVRDNKTEALKLDFTRVYNRHGMRVGTIPLEMRETTLEKYHTYTGLFGFCFAPMVFLLCLEGVKGL